MKKNGRCRKAEQLSEICAVNHLRRQDQKVRVASCCSYHKQLLAETTGFAEPLENKSTDFFPRVCYFLVIITDRALTSSATLGRMAGGILQWWMPRLVKCFLVKWEEYRCLTFWLRHLSQTTAYVSQKTVTCFFSPFSHFYRAENPATSEQLKTLY